MGSQDSTGATRPPCAVPLGCPWPAAPRPRMPATPRLPVAQCHSCPRAPPRAALPFHHTSRRAHAPHACAFRRFRVPHPVPLHRPMGVRRTLRVHTDRMRRGPHGRSPSESAVVAVHADFTTLPWGSLVVPDRLAGVEGQAPPRSALRHNTPRGDDGPCTRRATPPGRSRAGAPQLQRQDRHPRRPGHRATALPRGDASVRRTVVVGYDIMTIRNPYGKAWTAPIGPVRHAAIPHDHGAALHHALLARVPEHHHPADRGDDAAESTDAGRSRCRRMHATGRMLQLRWVTRDLSGAGSARASRSTTSSCPPCRRRCSTVRSIAGEYGVHVDGQTQQSTGGGLVHDLGRLQSLRGHQPRSISDGAVIYLDRNPIAPVNGGGNSDGTLDGYYYDNTGLPRCSSAPMAVIYVRDGYREIAHRIGGGGLVVVDHGVRRLRLGRGQHAGAARFRGAHRRASPPRSTGSAT